MAKENDKKRNVIKLEGGLGRIEIWAPRNTKEYFCPNT